MQGTTTHVQALAAEVALYFETATKTDGETNYVRVKEDSPEWVRDLVYAAHGDFGPDDWRYESIRSAVEFIAANGDDEDMAAEWADGNVDIYTGSRTAWLASNLNRAGYCDEGADEFGPPEKGIIEQIGWGQYIESQEIFAAVLDALRSHGEEA